MDTTKKGRTVPSHACGCERRIALLFSLIIHRTGNFMTDDRSGRWMKTALISAATATWLIYDMATATEAPRQAVAIMQYVLLGLALLGLCGAMVQALPQR
jgi:hypothetical protein